MKLLFVRLLARHGGNIADLHDIGAEKVAERLGYPLEFVKLVMEKNKQSIAIEPGAKPNILADWNDFKE